MDILNLTDGFAPLGTGTVSVSRRKIFSGGEVDLKLSGSVTSEVTITSRLNTSDDVLQLLFATDALRVMGARRLHLFVPYLPYARQDRIMEEGEAFSLRVFADIVNAQNYATVTMFDVHSDVGPALIRNSRSIPNHRLVARVLEGKANYRIVSPDAGAFKKIHQTCHAIGHNLPPAVCLKVRVLGGEIAGTTVTEADFGGADVFIIDDICDGGRTFIALAQELKKRNVGKINLIVSHGIFSYGEAPLRDGGIDHVYTTDSVKDIASLYVTQIPLREIL